ncbi:hypothetical protein ES703_106235 [subsurface metagenome]
MSLATLERAIWKEFVEVTGLEKTKLKDMQEWSSGEIGERDDEVRVFLPVLGVWAAFRKVE